VVQAPVALRVDVDTRRGLHEGVPRLLDLFRRLEVTASFFVTMGPDRSGLAIRRAWRPSFVLKMLRTNPFRLYGMRTLLSGTLLPALPVGAGAPALLRQIAAAGHEVAPHGWDHVGWQDRIGRLGPEDVRADLMAAARAFEMVFATPPSTSAAPGWRTSEAALIVQEEVGLAYASDVRGRAAFRPRVDGGPLKTVQVPTTMPTMDEMVGRVRDVGEALDAHLGEGLNVFTLHAEVEGGPLLDLFAGWLARVRRAGRALVPLRDLAERARTAPLPEARLGRAHVPGRSGWVAVANEGERRCGARSR
jgi:peptidoglycan/xylan/chitin deacetylase (PgdA/CDA1 family)